ncbi:hypothetical protein [Cytobacillus horneckiae]|uniref:hypothetical protein n=1 Tax=Cytobacillus horneckiae TaxID=549687 RepID=UPI003D9A1EFB
MNEIKEAWRLASFEIKASWKHLIFMVFYAILIGLGFSVFITETGLSLITDLFFILVFWCGSAWIKPKFFQLQKLDDGVYASTYFLLLNQLAIPRNIIINSRFFVYYFFSIPFNLLMLIALYIGLSVGVKEMMTLGSFLAFSIIWLSFGIGAGSMFPVADIGEKFRDNKLLLYLEVIFFYGGAIAIMILVNQLSSNGLVDWSIYAAQRWPVVSIIIAITIGLATFLYSKNQMQRKIPNIDYFK